MSGYNVDVYLESHQPHTPPYFPWESPEREPVVPHYFFGSMALRVIHRILDGLL